LALANGCHVFLTEDKRDILRHDEKLREVGIAAIRPQELLDELLAAGELLSRDAHPGSCPITTAGRT